MEDILQFPKDFILTYNMEKGEVETYFVLYFHVYTWEKVSYCNVYSYHEQVHSLI